MPDEFEKLDSGLVLAVLRRKESEDTESDAAISVTLTFEGDLDAIEALGFETHSVWETEALGVVRFRDIPALIQHPGVLWIAAGSEPRMNLGTAVHDGRVRASAPTKVGAGGDGVWHAVRATGVLTAAPNATGKDVIVAIIDSGIDFTHPMFMSQLTPKKTRIKRIWDQGLTPASLAECPDKSLLTSAQTYGVEYDDVKIDAALNGGAPVLHKDCVGHGTHVAGIAAGGVIFAPTADAKRMGVAPEADIIAVKLIDTPETIRFRKAAGFGAEVGPDRRFMDAVIYCLRTARSMGDKPVVINMSFSTRSEAGDALDSQSRRLDGLMDPSQAAGDKNFPTRAVIVRSAGNEGNLADRMVAVVKFPAAGQITVPLKLTDTRGPLQMRFINCARTLYKPDIDVVFWYRRANPFTAVKFAFRLPNQSTFSSDVEMGGWIYQGFIPKVGPPPTVAIVGRRDSVHRVFIHHRGEPAMPHPNGGWVRRHSVLFSLEPKDSGGTVSYHEGIYEMRITAPAGTEIFVMCGTESWASRMNVFFQIAPTMQNGIALDPNIALSREFSATDTLGRHVITVAAYDDANGNAANPNQHAIAPFSSRGPLRDFSDPANPLPRIASKPDIAAPGVKIDSARGMDTDVLAPIRLPAWLDGDRFIERDGTSMAAPFIAGVIALMFDKNQTLSTTDVRDKLAARPGVNPAAPGPDHANAYGIGMVDGLTSHANTP